MESWRRVIGQLACDDWYRPEVAGYPRRRRVR